MGMYDTVVIEGLKLPPVPKAIQKLCDEANISLPNDFQTKDLENCLLTYFIDKKGQVFVERHVATGKTTKQSPLWEAWKDNRTFLERLYFKYIDKKYTSYNKGLRTLPVFKKIRSKSNLTNTFNIYTSTEINNRYVDVEYKIQATDGKVKKIDLLKAEIESPTSAKKRKARNEKFEKNLAAELDKRRVFTDKWYYPILKEIYNPIIFFGRKSVQFICTKIITWTYRWRCI
jgi:hypothetical protein